MYRLRLWIERSVSIPLSHHFLLSTSCHKVQCTSPSALLSDHVGRLPQSVYLVNFMTYLTGGNTTELHIKKKEQIPPHPASIQLLITLVCQEPDGNSDKSTLHSQVVFWIYSFVQESNGNFSFHYSCNIKVKQQWEILSSQRFIL